MYRFMYCYLMFFVCFSMVDILLHAFVAALTYISGGEIYYPEMKYYIGYAIISFWVAVYYLWSKNR